MPTAVHQAELTDRTLTERLRERAEEEESAGGQLVHNVGSRAVHSMVALTSGAKVPAHSPVSATVMGTGALTHCRQLWLA